MVMTLDRCVGNGFDETFGVLIDCLFKIIRKKVSGLIMAKSCYKIYNLAL